jgi:beta-lactamase class A
LPGFRDQKENCDMRMRATTAGMAGMAALATTAGGIGGAAAAASPAGAAPVPAAAAAICTAPAKYASLAAKLSKDIAAALHGRTDYVGVRVEDRRTGVECRLNEGHQFDSASVVKATILAALLLWHQETGKPLTATEKHLATLMITQSDNDAATGLWNDVGRAHLQHFLKLATMTETVLGPDGYWGLTQITARDEVQLLRLLTASNKVLSSSSRTYELGLMARVITSQRWGVPAGAPKGLNVYVKNGWLPRATHGWRINSIGAFTGHGRNYMIVVLSYDNPTMDYGVSTVERVAEAVHKDLNAGLPSAGVPAAAVTIPASRQAPDETIPALPAVP